MARYMNPGSSTNRTIDAIDRKRERERRFMIRKAREKAADLAVALTQRLIDKHIIETKSASSIAEAIEKQLVALSDMEEFDLQFKIAPIRSLTVDPNIISLFITQFIIEDLIEHPAILDVFGDDLDVYKVVDSVFGRIRPR